MENLSTVLVIEDDMFIQNMVETTLLEGGFRVALSSSGEKAIDLLNTQQPPFCAIVSDINLGKSTLTGWDVAKRAREIDPEIAVIYMTGHGEDDWASHGVPKSVLVVKPFVPLQIVTALVNLLNQQS